MEKDELREMIVREWQEGYPVEHIILMAKIFTNTPITNPRKYVEKIIQAHKNTLTLNSD